MSKVLKKGAKIIWDSGYGFLTGYILQIPSKCPSYYVLKVETNLYGNDFEIGQFAAEEVFPFSEDLKSTLEQKYSRLFSKKTMDSLK